MRTFLLLTIALLSGCEPQATVSAVADAPLLSADPEDRGPLVAGGVERFRDLRFGDTPDSLQQFAQSRGFEWSEDLDRADAEIVTAVSYLPGYDPGSLLFPTPPPILDDFAARDVWEWKIMVGPAGLFRARVLFHRYTNLLNRLVDDVEAKHGPPSYVGEDLYRWDFRDSTGVIVHMDSTDFVRYEGVGPELRQSITYYDLDLEARSRRTAADAPADAGPSGD